MSVNPRRQNKSKRKFVLCILLLLVLGISAFYVNKFFIVNRPLFISPLGKTNVDLVYVKKLLEENKILFTQVNLSDNSYVVNIYSNGKVTLSLDKDLKKQISSLQRILIQLTIEGKPFKSIDFRFSEPIVSF